ncbi:MAG: helix-turn-helix domain-containing protein [Clostridia bacterium]|nr:helix-turn-helix domain-containing protein [Clostridia bacterium]
MIAVLTKNQALFHFLESLFSEYGFSVVPPEEARLTVVDLDTETAVKGPSVTVSETVFTSPDLLRPFEQDALITLCRERLGMDECQPAVVKRDGLDDKAIDERAFSLLDGAVSYGEDVIPLTSGEFRLFSCLFERRGEIVSEEELRAVMSVRAREDGSYGNSVAVTVNALRRKLDHRFGMRFIVSHRGRGYTFEG